MPWNRTELIDEDPTPSRSIREGSGIRIPVASRRSGFARLRSAILDASCSTILLTGEGGAGKTWLWNQAVRSLPSSWRSLSVDVTSSLTPSEFLLLAGDGFGLKNSPSLASSRLALADALRDDASDGRAWLLVVEDSHCATPEVWEEIRALVNHLGQPDGFASLLIVAHTELIRRFTDRGLASIGGRVTDHIHLPPLDLDECRALILDTAAPDHALSRTNSLEQLHRDARGNCREILRLARRNSGQSAEPLKEAPAPFLSATIPGRSIAEYFEHHSGSAANDRTSEQNHEAQHIPADAAVPSSAVLPEKVTPTSLSLVPSRPPLRLEEGLIEVGWGGGGDETPQSESTEGFDTRPDPLTSSEDRESPAADISRSEGPSISDGDLTRTPVGRNLKAAEPTEERVEDPYAALQAWSEWARHHDRAPGSRSDDVSTSGIRDDRFDDGLGQTDEDGSPPSIEETARSSSYGIGGGATIRVEPQHEFSPYGRLFDEVRKNNKQP